MPDTPSPPTPPNPLPGDAPNRLGHALKQAYPLVSADLSDLDAAILSYANARLGRRRLHPRLLLIGTGLATAAGLALAAIIITSSRSTPSPAGSSIAQATSPDDLNGDGRVDILDALALANFLRQPGASGSSPATDINADGVTTAADIDALALRVVDLGGAG